MIETVARQPWVLHHRVGFVPSLADPIDPITFVHKITAPVYLACQWTDEQTGGDCADLASHFTATRRKWFTFTNGVHFDSLDPATFTRMYDFLELFVAHRDPRIPAAFTALGSRRPIQHLTTLESNPR